MPYRVEISDSALADIENLYLSLRRVAPKAANAWFNKIEFAIKSLNRFPARCPLAPEDPYFSVTIRQRLVGARRRAYRILFTIKPSNTVQVLHVRHWAQNVLTQS